MIARVRLAAAALLGAAPLLLLAQPADQPPAATVDPLPPTIEACYVPASGTIYRINTTASPAPGAPAACLSPMHVRFAWKQQGVAGPAGPKGDKGDPGSPANIGPDLSLPGALTMGKTGTFGGGLLATDAVPLEVPQGSGSRMMWIPQRSAFRAGAVASGEWNLGAIGLGSIALGVNTQATGYGTVALGITTRATTQAAFAGGQNTQAEGIASVALGHYSVARGQGAIAMGNEATASGDGSVALGNGVVAGRGSFVFGDRTYGTGGGPAGFSSSGDNQFLVRATGGVRLRTSRDLVKGCDIDGDGDLSCTGGVAMTSSITRVAGAWADVGGASSASLITICPTGTVVVGGGVQTRDDADATGDPDFKVRQSFPEPTLNGWIAQVRNDSVFRGEARILVVCLRA